MATYVLVHGAWHTGKELENVADYIRSEGHTVYLPTLIGNRPGDPKSTGLEEAIQSLVDFFIANDIRDAIVLGHSYGGMVITALADRLEAGIIRRLIYWNAFVPNNGESLNDLVPAHYVAMFDQLESEDGSVVLPFEVWRDVFINDADIQLAEEAYNVLNPHPNATFKDKIRLATNPAAMPIAKSYINCTEDIAIPQSAGWHPRLSERLGVFRLVQTPGSHELCFTDPRALAMKIIEAGRD